jgi:hypothetical protein
VVAVNVQMSMDGIAAVDENFTSSKYLQEYRNLPLVKLQTEISNIFENFGIFHCFNHSFY